MGLILKPETGPSPKQQGRTSPTFIFKPD